jgi:hypothetical protein
MSERRLGDTQTGVWWQAAEYRRSHIEPQKSYLVHVARQKAEEESCYTTYFGWSEIIGPQKCTFVLLNFATLYAHWQPRRSERGQIIFSVCYYFCLRVHPRA